MLFHTDDYALIRWRLVASTAPGGNGDTSWAGVVHRAALDAARQSAESDEQECSADWQQAPRAPFHAILSVIWCIMDGRSQNGTESFVSKWQARYIRDDERSTHPPDVRLTILSCPTLTPMKPILFFILSFTTVLAVSCNKQKQAIDSQTDSTKTAIEHQKEAVDANAKEAKEQADIDAKINKANIDAKQEADKAQLDAEKKKVEAEAEAAKAKVDAQNK